MASRRRPDHAADMAARSDSSRLRSRRRKRRMAQGAIRIVFWGLVLTGVFILGLGYGKTLAGEEQRTQGKVTVDADRGPVEVTLPTQTVTVTTAAQPVPRAKKPAAAPATQP